MAVPKYKKFQRKITLLTGIEDIQPYELTLPEPPPIEQFVNYGLPANKQFFKKTEMSAELSRLCASVRSGKVKRADAILHVESKPELVKEIEGFWEKRLYGDWQIINGIPLHISPTYWFYLNFWPMNKKGGVGTPDFRCDFYHNSSDLQFFYFWDYLVKTSPFCEGCIEFTQRQVGKSFKLGVTGCEPALRIREYHSGYQSKTDTDISALFGKCIIRQWRNLPFFFSPIYSNSTFPKGQDGLQFTPRSNRGNNDGVETLDEGELMGSVTYRSSDEKAYDNATLDFYGADEIGKTTEVNIHKRWSMVRPALRQKDGKSYHTSTVEELEKMGGKHFKKLWDQSCRIPDLPKEINALGEFGETISGLWPWFTPSYINQHYDQFGFSVANEINEEQKVFLRDVSKQKYWWMTGREAIDHMIKIAGNQEEQQEIIRKHPRNIKEAFLSANGKSYFNLSILNDNLGRHRMGYTVAEREYMKWGMFRWKNGVFGGDVEFVETDFANAKFHASYFPPEGMRNVKVPVPGGKFKPANAALFRSGADPFKFDTQDVKYKKDMSWASQHIYMFYDETVDGGKPRKEWISNNIIYEYYYRGDHQSVDEMCEDFLMACIFYGCKVYPERNNDDVLKYFKRHGFEHYTHFAVRVAISEGNLIYKQEATAGATTNDKTIEKMWRHVQDFVNNDAAACPFYRTIQDVKDVDRADLNPFDLFVSLSYTLMSAYEADIATKQEEQKPTTTREILEAIYEADWSDL